MVERKKDFVLQREEECLSGKTLAAKCSKGIDFSLAIRFPAERWSDVFDGNVSSKFFYFKRDIAFARKFHLK